MQCKTALHRGYMNLRDYMHFNKVTLREMAKLLKIAPNYLGAISRGERTPSYRLAEMIEIKLNGEVTIKEIFDYYKEIQRQKKDA